MISQLDFGPVSDDKENWMVFSKCWNFYTMHTDDPISTSTHSLQMTCVFANPTYQNAIYPLTIQEIANAQQEDTMLQSSKQDSYQS